METIFGDDNEQSRFIRISNQSTFYGFSQDEIVQNSAEFEDDEEIEDNTALLSSAQCQSAVNKAQALKTVYERLNAQCKAQSLVNQGRLFRLSKGSLSSIAKVREENPQLRDGEIRM